MNPLWLTKSSIDFPSIYSIIVYDVFLIVSFINSVTFKIFLCSNSFKISNSYSATLNFSSSSHLIILTAKIYDLSYLLKHFLTNAAVPSPKYSKVSYFYSNLFLYLISSLNPSCSSSISLSFIIPFNARVLLLTFKLPLSFYLIAIFKLLVELEEFLDALSSSSKHVYYSEEINFLGIIYY